MVSELAARLLLGVDQPKNNTNIRSSPSPLSSSFMGTTTRNNYGTKTYYYSDRVMSCDSIMRSSSNMACVTPPNVDESVESVEPMVTVSACTQKLSKFVTHSKNSGKDFKARRRGVSFAPDVNVKKDVSTKKNRVHSRNSNNGCFKRRKVDELQFAASRVKMDLEKGGLSFPALDLSLRHYLDRDCCDISTESIQLLSSKSVGDSPFLWATETLMKDWSSQATMDDLENLFSVTYDSYSTANNMTSGSVTDSTTKLSKDTALSLFKQYETEARTPEIDAVYANPISIRDAFEVPNEARLVTLSFAPFLVVHVNAAYTQLTGIRSADILGKPFCEAIQDPTCKRTTSQARTLASLNEQVTTFVSPSASNGACTCRIQVSIVGTNETAVQPQQQNHTTHFLVSLEQENTEAETAATDETVEVPAATCNKTGTIPTPSLEPINVPIEHTIEHTMRLHCGVMG